MFDPRSMMDIDYTFNDFDSTCVTSRGYSFRCFLQEHQYLSSCWIRPFETLHLASVRNNNIYFLVELDSLWFTVGCLILELWWKKVTFLMILILIVAQVTFTLFPFSCRNINIYLLVELGPFWSTVRCLILELWWTQFALSMILTLLVAHDTNILFNASCRSINIYLPVEFESLWLTVECLIPELW